MIIPKSERNPYVRDKGTVVLKQTPGSQEAKYVFILRSVALNREKVIFAFERGDLISAMRKSMLDLPVVVASEM